MSKSSKNITISQRKLTAEDFQSFHRPLNLDPFPEKSLEPPDYSELIIDEMKPTLYGNLITIPRDCFFWRGYNTDYPAISEKPAYYGSYETAKPYAKRYTNNRVSCFTNTQPLKLLDVNYMKVILKQLLDTIKLKKEYYKNNTIYDGNEEKCIAYITTSFGLCSLYHQIQLMKKIYPEPDKIDGFNKLTSYYNTLKYSLIEQSGVRVAETTVDSVTMTFLKCFFKDFADGFISPRMVSPFHVEKEDIMSSEIIIFNPLKSGIKILNTALLPKNVDKIYISNLIATRNKVVNIGHDNFDMIIYDRIKGGNKSKDNTNINLHPLDEFNSKIAKNDKVTIQLEKIGEKYGKLWKDEYFFPTEVEPRNPTHKIRREFRISEDDIRKMFEK